MRAITYKLLGDGWKYYNSYVDLASPRRVIHLYLPQNQYSHVDSCDLILTIDSDNYQQEANFRLKCASDIHIKRVLRLREKSDQVRLDEFIAIYRKYGGYGQKDGPFDVWKGDLLCSP